MKKIIAATFAGANSLATFWQPVGVTVVRWLDKFLTWILSTCFECPYNHGVADWLINGMDKHKEVLFISQMATVLIVGYVIWNYVLRTSSKNKVDCKLQIAMDSLQNHDKLFRIMKRSNDSRCGDRTRVVECSSKDVMGQYSFEECDFKELVLSDLAVATLMMGSDAKLGKIFPQCMFVPVDADGYTIIILRNKAFHSTLMCRLANWLKDRFSYVSVSPVPLRFRHDKYDLSAWYHQKVPMKGVEPRFVPVGVYYHALSEGCASRGYLTCLYIAYYEHEHFAGPDGKMNVKVIRRLFSRPGLEDKLICLNRYFNIDHDKVIGVRKVSEIERALTDEGGNDATSWLEIERRSIMAVRRHVDELIET